MTDFRNKPSDMNDNELEKLLKSSLAHQSVEHLKKLDMRMSPAFSESPQPTQHKRGPVQPRTLRLVLSHAVIAALFFGAGWIFFGERPAENLLQSNETSGFQLRQAAPPEGFGVEEADQSGILQFESPVKVAGPSAEEPKALLGRVLAQSDLDESIAKLNATPQVSQTQDAASESGGAAPAEASQPSAMLYKAIPESEPLEYTAQFQNGFLYVLTPTSVVRVRLEGTESILENLQSPADWRFDGEGNLFVVDQTSEGAVVYRLKRIEPSK